jgi:hypothetical protein
MRRRLVCAGDWRQLLSEGIFASAAGAFGRSRPTFVPRAVAPCNRRVYQIYRYPDHYHREETRRTTHFGYPPLTKENWPRILQGDDVVVVLGCLCAGRPWREACDDQVSVVSEISVRPADSCVRAPGQKSRLGFFLGITGTSSRWLEGRSHRMKANKADGV